MAQDGGGALDGEPAGPFHEHGEALGVGALALDEAAQGAEDAVGVLFAAAAGEHAGGGRAEHVLTA